MNTGLLYGTFFALAVTIIFWICNIVRAAKKKPESKVLGRLVYGCGAVAIILNTVRMVMNVTAYKGTLILANIVAFICIIVAYIRYERS